MARTHDGGWLYRDLLASAPIFAAGSALHFAFAWLDAWPPAALVAAVNESVWEHLKIAFWPALIWALAQGLLRRPRPAGYWAARGLGLLTISLTIVAGFYGYTALLGGNLLVLDISLFALAILLGQAVAALALAPAGRWAALRAIGGLLLLAQTAAFAAFTYAPPRLMLFEDGRNGLYGLAAYEAPARRRAD